MPKPKTNVLGLQEQGSARFLDREDFKNRLPAIQQDVKSIPHRKK